MKTWKIAICCLLASAAVNSPAILQDMAPPPLFRVKVQDNNASTVRQFTCRRKSFCLDQRLVRWTNEDGSAGYLVLQDGWTVQATKK
jgi:hypothetical protein